MQHKNGVKCNLISENEKNKKRFQGTTLIGQMPLPNIHLNKGKYPYSGKEPLNLVLCLISATVAKFMQTSPNNKTNMPQGYKQTVSSANTFISFVCYPVE